jgi:FkbM family methyltransferase
VGANFGIMTLQFAQAAPKGQVYSFEPTHYALARFKRNLALNPELARIIHPINSFVSSETNTNPNITAFSSWKVDGEVAENLHPQHLGAPKPTEGVGSVTLDSFYQQNKLDRIDFIKIDVDGHEYEVLQGAKELMKKFRPVVIFEMSLYLLEENKIEYSVFDTYFKDLNYSLIHSTNGKPITAENYMQIIPAKGTIDILARPL